MLTKLFIFIMLAVIVGSLFSALWFLYKDGGKGTRTVKSLTVRITLSIALFIMLLIGYKLGWITPHGVGQ
jgi:hypothetical protein